jgi:hypothetical protein
VRAQWYRALAKSKLDERDPRTNRFKLHIHSLRKFFRSNIGLDFDKTNCLLGHSEYLDNSYRRISQGVLSKAYLEVMENVSVYGLRLSGRIEALEERINKQDRELRELRSIITADQKLIGDLAKEGKNQG